MSRLLRCLAVLAAVSATVTAAPAGAQDASPDPDTAAGAYYAAAVSALAEDGVFVGTECDEGFCPDTPIDRATMAVWTVRVLDKKDPSEVTSTRFSDVDASHPHAEFIERFAQLGVTKGCGDGTRFCPDDTVTRVQMAVFLSRAFSLPEGPDPGFRDVASDAWFAADVAALAASGITKGCGNGTTFCPFSPTTRGQMATFLHRALEPQSEPSSDASACRADNFGAPSTGNVRVAVLFVDFPDLPASRTTRQVAEAAIPLAEQYIEDSSYNKLDLEFVPLHRWLRAANSYHHYEVEALHIGGSVLGRAITREAVQLADAEFDFSGSDILLTLIPEGTPNASDAGGRVETNEGAIGTSSRITFTAATAHELMHNLGLPDLYPYDSPRSVFWQPRDTAQYWIHRSDGWTQVRFGIMGLDNIFVPPQRVSWSQETLAWSRWQLGWLDDDQVRCVTESEATVTLSPIVDPADGIAMAAIPISKTEYIVMESRRRIGYDALPAPAIVDREGVSVSEELGDDQENADSAPTLVEGVFVYTVDTAIPSGQLPIKGANETTHTYSSESPFLIRGDSITVRGYRVFLVSDDQSSHTISITQTDGPRPTVAMWSWSEPIVYDKFDVTISFTEPVTGFEQGDLVVIGGSVTSFGELAATQRPQLSDGESVTSFDELAFGGFRYEATITPDGDGEVIVSIGAGVAEDAYGQPSEASEPLTRQSAVEGRPAVTISSNAPPIVNDRFDVNISFSKPVTDFEESDLPVWNGVVSSFSGSGADYTVTIIPGDESPFVTVFVSERVAHDAFGRPNIASSTPFCRKTTDDPRHRCHPAAPSPSS